MQSGAMHALSGISVLNHGSSAPGWLALAPVWLFLFGVDSWVFTMFWAGFQ